MLNKEPNERISIYNILQHPWIMTHKQNKILNFDWTKLSESSQTLTEFGDLAQTSEKKTSFEVQTIKSKNSSTTATKQVNDSYDAQMPIVNPPGLTSQKKKIKSDQNCLIKSQRK